MGVIWIGIDAHKRLHQAMAVGAQGEIRGERTITNEPEQWVALLEWARSLDAERIWAVEGAWYLGRGLAQHLARSGERVHEVNGRWTAQRRRGMRKPGKSDRLDARAVVQLLREEAETLPRVYAEEDPLAAVQLWSRMQAETTEDITRLINRVHALLLVCEPGYEQRLPALTTKAGIQALRTYTAPGDGELAREREGMVRSLAEQLWLLAQQDRELRSKLERASTARFSPLRKIEGIGPIIACGIVAETGRPRAGFREEHFAAGAGVAPLEASSAGGTRHRLSRSGNRRLNMFLHQIVLTQSRTYEPARTYLARRRAEGLTAREARRALKRFVARRVFHALTECFGTSSEAVAA
jgi:transposase